MGKKNEYAYTEVPLTDVVITIETIDVGGRNWTYLTIKHTSTGLMGTTHCREKEHFDYVDMVDAAMINLLRNLNDPIHVLVYTYPLVNPDGFNTVEVHQIMEDAIDMFGSFNKDRYWNTLRGNTCGGAGIYHCDIVTALNCGTEDRDMTINEWD